MRVLLISTEGPWLEATIETPYGTFSVMDEFSMDDRQAPGIGDQFEVQLSALLDEDESWESKFSSNPEERKGVEQIVGWSYRAFGEVVSVNPVVVDCGIMQIPDVFYSRDARVVGEFVAFTVTRLGATHSITSVGH